MALERNTFLRNLLINYPSTILFEIIYYRIISFSFKLLLEYLWILLMDIFSNLALSSKDRRKNRVSGHRWSHHRKRHLAFDGLRKDIFSLTNPADRTIFGSHFLETVSPVKVNERRTIEWFRSSLVIKLSFLRDLIIQRFLSLFYLLILLNYRQLYPPFYHRFISHSMPTFTSA